MTLLQIRLKTTKDPILSRYQVGGGGEGVPDLLQICIGIPNTCENISPRFLNIFNTRGSPARILKLSVFDDFNQSSAMKASLLFLFSLVGTTSAFSPLGRFGGGGRKSHRKFTGKHKGGGVFGGGGGGRGGNKGGGPLDSSAADEPAEVCTQLSLKEVIWIFFSHAATLLVLSPGWGSFRC